jgi:hypothetical protein
MLMAVKARAIEGCSRKRFLVVPFSGKHLIVPNEYPANHPIMQREVGVRKHQYQSMRDRQAYRSG